jgi:hypothetical protein
MLSRSTKMAHENTESTTLIHLTQKQNQIAKVTGKQNTHICMYHLKPFHKQPQNDG